MLRQELAALGVGEPKDPFLQPLNASGDGKLLAEAGDLFAKLNDVIELTFQLGLLCLKTLELLQ